MTTENTQIILSAEDQENERWEEVGHHRGAFLPNYIVSNMGRLRHKNRPTVDLKFTLRGKRGKLYYKTNLYQTKIEGQPLGKPKTADIHHLVADKFLPPNLNPALVIDHRNQNQLDNRACNLRWATISENGVNSKVWSNNTSGVKGVSWDKSRNKFSAIVQFGNKKHFYGHHDTIEEATLARAEGERFLFPTEFRPTVI